MTTVAPYPLQWPAGRKRRTAYERKAGAFSSSRESPGAHAAISVSAALDRLQAELDRIGAKHPVVSSNLETRLNGLPKSTNFQPGDPGVAVYFHLGGRPTCLPCDTYSRVAQNIAAVAAHIAATRAIERHGVATVAEMFHGFAQLPPPEKPRRPWWEVLGVARESPAEMINAAFRIRAKTAHVDAGGSHDAMAELSAARDAALAERKS